MTDPQRTTSAQLATLAQRDDYGIAFSPSFEVTLYSGEPRPRIASPAIACYQRFLEQHGADVTSYLASAMTKSQKFTAAKREVFPTLCADERLDTLPMFRAFRGAGNMDYSPPVFMTGGFSRKFSCVQVQLPPDYVHRPEQALDVVARMASNFPYRSGYAGIAVCWNELSVDRETTVPPHLKPLLKRYPGLSPGIPRTLSEQPMPPYNWLTLLGPELLETVGGRSRVQRELSGGGISVLEMGDGVCIRAGDYPELGDRNRQDTLPLYRRIGAYFKPFRVYETIRIKGMDFEETEEWLARFDS